MSRDSNRKYAVSANRTESRHRIRYVETGGAAVDAGECAFCESTPVLTDSEQKEGAVSLPKTGPCPTGSSD
ncbi:hypothetical protein SAMN04487963_2983 [Marinobacter zhejiangensis]|uniref:Uncharacterized protein n=1 Tax=Marinobacter zhejiangensis TaxID=488535 RepID=A0A1I4RWM8_9GAMM|nr:hypothetical protein SAMN04487963_2983 [Marinobacter zhejiangensis]